MTALRRLLGALIVAHVVMAVVSALLGDPFAVAWFVLGGLLALGVDRAAGAYQRRLGQ